LVLNDIDIKKILDNSNLLQFSLSITENEVNIFKKKSTQTIIPINQDTRIELVRIDSEIYDSIKDDIHFFIEKLTPINSYLRYEYIFIPKIKDQIRKTFFKEMDIIKEYDLFQKFSSNLITDITIFLKYAKTIYNTYSDKPSLCSKSLSELLGKNLFIKKLIKSDLYDKIHFVESLKNSYPDLLEDIRFKYKHLFTNQKFLEKLKNNRFEVIFKFYSNLFIKNSIIDSKTLVILGEILKNITVSEIFNSLTHLEIKDIEFVVKNFKKEINQKIKDTPKSIIRKLYGKEGDFFPLNVFYLEKMDFIRKFFPIIEKKIDEKYFYEP
jgi:hypothetical protein